MSGFDLFEEIQKQTAAFRRTTVCTHPAYMCSAEKRGDDHVLVCPCGHVRVCIGDLDAMVWAHVDIAALSRELRDKRLDIGYECAWPDERS